MSCHLQHNVAKVIGPKEQRLKKLNFKFESSAKGNVNTPNATAFINLTEKQFENFFLMRELALGKNMTAVELFIHGVQWEAPAPHLENADFLVHTSKGVALKAYYVGSRGQQVQSGWIDWSTLDLLYVIGDSFEEISDAGEKNTANSRVAATQAPFGVRNVLQLV